MPGNERLAEPESDGQLRDTQLLSVGQLPVAQAAVEGVPVAWIQQTSLQADMFRELAQRIA